MIIAFEGHDGAGKGPLSQLLKKKLQSLGYKVIIRHTSLVFGKDVTKSDYDKVTKYFLYLGAINSATKRALEDEKKGIVTILDRTIYSHYVYESFADWIDPTCILTDISFIKIPNIVVHCKRMKTIKESNLYEVVEQFNYALEQLEEIRPKKLVDSYISFQDEGKVNKTFDHLWSKLKSEFPKKKGNK